MLCIRLSAVGILLPLFSSSVFPFSLVFSYDHGSQHIGSCIRHFHSRLRKRRGCSGSNFSSFTQEWPSLLCQMVIIHQAGQLLSPSNLCFLSLVVCLRRKLELLSASPQRKLNVCILVLCAYKSIRICTQNCAVSRLRTKRFV